MKKVFTMFFACFLAVAVNAQSVDYQLLYFVDNSTDQNEITELTLGLSDDLNPSVILMNNGPDVPGATDSLFIDISIDGSVLGAMYLPGAQLADITAGGGTILSGQAPLMTADQMTENGIEGQFELCYTTRLVGASSDPDDSNNQACITIIRGSSSINEVAQGEVSVYPNPATDVINVANATNAQISVFDLTGKMIVNIESASANETIDASNFAKGLYFVRISNGNNVITKKVSVVK